MAAAKPAGEAPENAPPPVTPGTCCEAAQYANASIGALRAEGWEAQRVQAKQNLHTALALLALLTLLLVQDKQIQALTRAVKALQP
jgi:hypothetical protein